MLSDQNLQCTNTHRKEQKKASNCVVNYVFFYYCQCTFQNQKFMGGKW